MDYITCLGEFRKQSRADSAFTALVWLAEMEYSKSNIYTFTRKSNKYTLYSTEEKVGNTRNKLYKIMLKVEPLEGVLP